MRSSILAPSSGRFFAARASSGAFINFDMESLRAQKYDSRAVQNHFDRAGVQRLAACRDCHPSLFARFRGDLRDLIEWGRARGTRFAVRLVKGAYWDYETTKSGQNGSNPPVFLQKPESDANFEKLTRVLFENNSVVTPAFGSHNVRSIAHAQAVADELGIDRSRFEFQLLYGMAGPIKRALVEMGYRVREYCPVGELLPGMAYLVRRLLEKHVERRIFASKICRERAGERIAARSQRN
jgi:RHH-type proline utilization regulon transcriptional repressor/proline dehydrogenase/delta 1-pyrroline-5-carboxylate dehydrogenase